MLERLEAERQREIDLRLKEKQKRVDSRKQRLVEERNQRINEEKRWRERAMQKIQRQAESIPMETRENLEIKMRRAEDKKAAMRLQAEDKQEMVRMRRLRASIKSRASKAQAMEMQTQANSEVIMEESQAELQSSVAAGNSSFNDCYDCNVPSKVMLWMNYLLNSLYRFFYTFTVFLHPNSFTQISGYAILMKGVSWPKKRFS